MGWAQWWSVPLLSPQARRWKHPHGCKEQAGNREGWLLSVRLSHWRLCSWWRAVRCWKFCYRTSLQGSKRGEGCGEEVDCRRRNQSLLYIPRERHLLPHQGRAKERERFPILSSDPRSLLQPGQQVPRALHCHEPVPDKSGTQNRWWRTCRGQNSTVDGAALLGSGTFAYAYMNVVHRDVKPANILLDSQDQVKLIETYWLWHLLDARLEVWYHERWPQCELSWHTWIHSSRALWASLAWPGALFRWFLLHGGCVLGSFGQSHCLTSLRQKKKHQKKTKKMMQVNCKKLWIKCWKKRKRRRQRILRHTALFRNLWRNVLAIRTLEHWSFFPGQSRMNIIGQCLARLHRTWLMNIGDWCHVHVMCSLKSFTLGLAPKTNRQNGSKWFTWVDVPFENSRMQRHADFIAKQWKDKWLAQLLAQLLSSIGRPERVIAMFNCLSSPTFVWFAPFQASKRLCDSAQPAPHTESWMLLGCIWLQTICTKNFAIEARHTSASMPAR